MGVTSRSDLDNDYDDDMDDLNHMEASAKKGLSTTTPGDAGSGAAKGGGAMLALAVPSGNLDAATARSIVEKYGGGNIDIY